MNNIMHHNFEQIHSFNRNFNTFSHKWVIASGIMSIFLFALFAFIKSNFNGLNANDATRRLRNINENANGSEYNTDPEVNSFVENILNDITKEKYSGNWTSVIESPNSIVGKGKKGRVELQLTRGKGKKDNKNVLELGFKCLEGIFIDNWVSFDSQIHLKDIQIDNLQSNIQLLGNYTSIQRKGQLLKQKSKDEKCNSQIMLSLSKDNNGLIDYSQFKLSYSSSCGFMVELILIPNSSKSVIREKISFYTFYSSTTATISMIINFYLIKMLTQAESNIKALSLTFISMNTLWDFYCFIVNFAFSIKYMDFFFQFITPSILFLCLFLLVDLQLLYYYWKIKRKNLTDAVVKRKTIIFSVLVILGLLLSIIMLYDFFFSKTCIMLLVTFIWIPQIFNNIIGNNNTALPVVYSVLQTITRMTIPLYFRGYKGNFISVSIDSGLMTKCLLIASFSLLFVGSQSLFGARWFLPKCLKKDLKEEIYYYSQEDAMNMFPNYINEDCVICLIKLFDKALPLTNTQRDLDDNSSVDVSIPPSTYHMLQKPDSVTSSYSDSLASFTSVVLSFLLDFHEWKFKQKKSNLPYMITQCNHLFHSTCLELWLRQVKKCPSCRKEITIIPI